MLQSKENSPSSANHSETGDHSQTLNTHTTPLQQSSLACVIPSASRYNYQKVSPFVINRKNITTSSLKVNIEIDEVAEKSPQQQFKVTQQ
jgi:hypothetical protein